MTRSMVVPSGLYHFANQMSDAASQVKAVRATFNSSAAVANVGSDAMPSKDVQAQYDQAVKGTQNQLDAIAAALDSWAQALNDAAKFYQGTDANVAASIMNIGA